MFLFKMLPIRITGFPQSPLTFRKPIRFSEGLRPRKFQTVEGTAQRRQDSVKLTVVMCCSSFFPLQNSCGGKDLKNCILVMKINYKTQFLSSATRNSNPDQRPFCADQKHRLSGFQAPRWGGHKVLRGHTSRDSRSVRTEMWVS